MRALAQSCPTRTSSAWTYSRRQPEKTTLYQVMQQHLPSFDRMWTDTDSGNCLPTFVTEELQKFRTRPVEDPGSQWVPKPPDAENKTKAGVCRRYIPWYELLRRTFGSEVLCPACGGKLRLIALVKKEETLRKILAAMHFPTGPPKVSPARPPVGEKEELELSGGRADEEWLD